MYLTWEDNRIIKDFNVHPFFYILPRLSNVEVHEFLRERWHLSSQFVSFCDHLVIGMKDEDLKKIPKRIMQDETPMGLPSHREDLLADNQFMGISKRDLLNHEASFETRRVIRGLYRLVNYSEDPYHDLKALIGFRTAGEILVGVEYGHLVPELEHRFGLTEIVSRFFWPHYKQDSKGSETGTHANSFEEGLDRLIVNPKTLEIAKDTANKAYEIKKSFYNQFNEFFYRRGNFSIAQKMAEWLGGFPSDYLKDINSKQQLVSFLRAAATWKEKKYSDDMLLHKFLSSADPRHFTKHDFADHFRTPAKREEEECYDHEKKSYPELVELEVEKINAVLQFYQETDSEGGFKSN